MNEQQRIKGVFLVADTIYGVYQADPIDFPEAFRMRPRDFYEALQSLDEGETIAAHFDGDSEMFYDWIQEQFGIR